MSEWLESLGYLGALLGSFLEGEIIYLSFLQAAGVGYLHFGGVVAATFVGTLCADWTFYLAGRRKGQDFIKERPDLLRQFQAMEKLLNTYEPLLLFLYRFMYGFRIVLPALFGMKGISRLRFGLYSACAVAVWTALFGYLGYHFSEWLIEHLQAWKKWLYLPFGLCIAALLIWWWHRRRR